MSRREGTSPLAGETNSCNVFREEGDEGTAISTLISSVVVGKHHSTGESLSQLGSPSATTKGPRTPTDASHSYAKEESEIKAASSNTNSSYPLPHGGAPLVGGGSSVFASVSELPLRRSISTLQRYKRPDRVAAELGDHPDVTNPSVIASMACRNNSFHFSGGSRQQSETVTSSATTTATTKVFDEDFSNSPLPLDHLKKRDGSNNTGACPALVRSQSNSHVDGVVLVSSSEDFTTTRSSSKIVLNGSGEENAKGLSYGASKNESKEEIINSVSPTSPNVTVESAQPLEVVVATTPSPKEPEPEVKPTEEDAPPQPAPTCSSVLVHLVEDDKAYTRRFGCGKRSHSAHVLPSNHFMQPSFRSAHTHFGYFAPAPPHPTKISALSKESKDDVTFVTSGEEKESHHFQQSHHHGPSLGGTHSYATGTTTAASTHPVTPHFLPAPRTPGHVPHPSEAPYDNTGASSQVTTPSHRGLSIGHLKRRAHSLAGSPHKSIGHTHRGTPSTASLTTAPTTHRPRYVDSTSELSFTNRSSHRYLRRRAGDLSDSGTEAKCRHKGFIFDRYTHTEDGALRPTIKATAYGDGVTGRHLMLKSVDRIQIWKMAESENEERFYRFASDHQDYCDWIEMMVHYQKNGSYYAGPENTIENPHHNRPQHHEGEMKQKHSEAAEAQQRQTQPSSFDSQSFPASGSVSISKQPHNDTLSQHPGGEHLVYQYLAPNPPPSVVDPSFAADHPKIAAATGAVQLTEQDAALHQLWQFIPQFYGVYKVGKLEVEKPKKSSTATDGGLTTATDYSDVETTETFADPNGSQGASKPSSFPTGAEYQSPTLPPAIAISSPASNEDFTSPTSSLTAAQLELVRRTRQVLASANLSMPTAASEGIDKDLFERPRSASTIIMPSHRYDTTKAADSDTLVAQFELIMKRKCDKAVPVSASYNNLLSSHNDVSPSDSPSLLSKPSPCENPTAGIVHRRVNSYTDGPSRPISTSTSPRLLSQVPGKDSNQTNSSPHVPPMELPRSFDEDMTATQPTVVQSNQKSDVLPPEAASDSHSAIQNKLLLSPTDAASSQTDEKKAKKDKKKVKKDEEKQNEVADDNTSSAATEGSSMIVLDDICKGMRYPCVLDLKMGPRQYGIGASEKKIKSKEEKARNSTTASHGVRLGGMKMYVPGEVALSAIPDKTLLRRRGDGKKPDDSPTLLSVPSEVDHRPLSPVAAAAVESHIASLNDLTSKQSTVACIRLDKICGRSLLPHELGEILAEFSGSPPVLSVQRATGMDFAPATVTPAQIWKKRSKVTTARSKHHSTFASVNTSTNKESFGSFPIPPIDPIDATESFTSIATDPHTLFENTSDLREQKVKQLQRLLIAELKRFRRTFARQDSFRFFTSSLLVVVDALDLLVGSPEEISETLARHNEIVARYEEHRNQRRGNKVVREGKNSGVAQRRGSSITPKLFARTAEPTNDSLSNALAAGTIPSSPPAIPSSFHHRANKNESDVTSSDSEDDRKRKGESGNAPSSGYDSDCSTDDEDRKSSSSATSVDSFCSSCSFSDEEYNDRHIDVEREHPQDGVDQQHSHHHNPLKDVFNLKIRMIDFAFTYSKEALKAANDPDGNTDCDVGYLKGIDSIIKLLSEAVTPSKSQSS